MTSRTYRALLIANSTFPADTVNLPELEGPRNDPVVLRDALCDGEVGLFPTDNVRLVTERTMAEVLGEVEDFLRSATNQDTVLLYYSGHGMLDQTGELFLCTRDSRQERLRSTAVKASDLRAMMDESAAAATVVVLDCCHSGRFKGGEIPAALSGRGRFVLTSSRSGELANDADLRNHASLFTHHLAEGLLHGAEDVDGDGLVTLSELYTYVHTALVGAGRPVPQKRFEGDGDVAMALRATRPELARTQPELVDPTSATPVLDLSTTEVPLGEIDADEELPPERVAVINRGGGTLTWTVESSAPWVTAVAVAGAAVLHLNPTPGPNRANVYVRETTTGALKTIRVSVRVRPSPDPESPAPDHPEPDAPGPDPRPDAAERDRRAAVQQPAAPPMLAPATVDPASRQAAEERGRQAAADWYGDFLQRIEDRLRLEREMAGGWRRVVSTAYVVAGCLFLTMGYRLNDAVAGDLTERGEWGAGILPSILGGLVLVVIGFLAFVPRFHVRMVAVGLGVAVPLFLTRISEQVGFGWSAFAWSWALGFGAAGLAAISLSNADAWRASPWASRTLDRGARISAAIWAASLLVDPYDQDAFGGSTYGGAFSADYLASTIPARVWSLVAAASVVVLVAVGLRRLVPVAGSSLVVGAAITPVLAVVNEITYLVAGHEDPDGARRLMIMVTAAAAVVACSVAGVLQSGHPPRWRPRTLSGWIRERPITAFGTVVVASLSLVGGWVALPDGPSGEQLVILRIEDSKLSPGAFSPDRDLLAVSAPGQPELWDILNGRRVRSLGGADADASAFSPDGNLVATAGTFGVRIWDPSGSEITELGGEDAVSVVFSPDGSRLAAADATGVVLWETATREQVGTIPITGGAREVWFSPDGDRLAIWTNSGALATWDVETSNQLRRLYDDDGSVVATAIAFSSDWRSVAVADSRGDVVVWDPERDRPLGSVAVLDEPVEAMAFSPDESLLAGQPPAGDLLAVASGKRVELFDPDGSPRHLASLTGHDSTVNSVVFSPDGERLASASDDSVRVWDPDER